MDTALSVLQGTTSGTLLKSTSCGISWIRKHDIPKARAVKILTPAVTHVSWDDDKGPCGANFSKTPAFDVLVMRMGSVDW